MHPASSLSAYRAGHARLGKFELLNGKIGRFGGS